MLPTSLMLTHRLPSADTPPVSTVACFASVFVITSWHAVPFQVPRLSPTSNSLSGDDVVNVAVTTPLAWVVKLWSALCRSAHGPLNVSVTVGGGVGAVGVGSSSPHAVNDATIPVRSTLESIAA